MHYCVSTHVCMCVHMSAGAVEARDRSFDSLFVLYFSRAGFTGKCPSSHHYFPMCAGHPHSGAHDCVSTTLVTEPSS